MADGHVGDTGPQSNASQYTICGSRLETNFVDMPVGCNAGPYPEDIRCHFRDSLKALQVQVQAVLRQSDDLYLEQSGCTEETDSNVVDGLMVHQAKSGPKGSRIFIEAAPTDVMESNLAGASATILGLEPAVFFFCRLQTLCRITQNFERQLPVGDQEKFVQEGGGTVSQELENAEFLPRVLFPEHSQPRNVPGFLRCCEDDR